MTKINIKYNQTLDPIFLAHFKSFEKWKDASIPSKEKVIEHTKLYKIAWGKYEKIISDAIYEVLGLNFKRNIIDVNIVSRSVQPIANPVVISSGLSMAEFVFCLAHELMHVLYRDNEKEYQNIFKYLSQYSEEIGVVNHVMIYPFLKYIFSDVLNEPQELEHEINKGKEHKIDIYTKTWVIIEKVGYKTLMQQIKERATQ